MQLSVLDILVCPVSREKLTLQTIREESRTYGKETVTEVMEGILTSPVGYIFPIVNGVPRMQLESFLDFSDFLKKNMPDFERVKTDLMKRFGYVIRQCLHKNQKTKDSFSQEWGIFNYGEDTTWNYTKESRKQEFLQHVDMRPEDLYGKRFIDVGCGNGVLTSALSEYGMETYGIDVSFSIERAFLMNQNPRVHFIHGDLQNPPFQIESFDIVFSSGVIHHTNSTELSFAIINRIVKPGGRLYVWLYHPVDAFKDKLYNRLRAITKHIPLKIQYYTYLIFLVPLGLLREKLEGRKRNWRVQLINYLDRFSPEFRFEHTPEETAVWYAKWGYRPPKTTSVVPLGFGIVGIKKV